MNERFDKLVYGTQNKIHLVFDLVLAVFCFYLAIPHASGNLQTQAWVLTSVNTIAFALAAAIMRLYSPLTPRRLLDSLVLRGVAIATAMLLTLTLQHFCWPDFFIDSWFFMIMFFSLSSVLRIVLFKPLVRVQGPSEHVLIIGTGSLAFKTYRHLTRGQDYHKNKIIGFLSLAGETSPSLVEHLPEKILGKAEDLLEILNDYPVFEVYIAGEVIQHGQQMQTLVTQCERIGMPFALPLHVLRFERATLQSNSPARDGYLHYMSTPWHPIQYALKRLIDILVSATALIVLSPLLIAVMIAIKFTSKGPILFKQRRVGLHGVPFNLLKFRSMVVNAEEIKASLMQKNEQTGPVFKMERDPRVTSIGRFIRKFSIDELPQLINILCGEMTIVGPRPALSQEVAQYRSWQRRRLSVRPGLTCYWQVSGRNSIGFEEWMRLDLRYVDNWSLGLDFQLIAQTVPVVVYGRGAS